MENLNQIFDNNSNCYADSDDVIMAMDKEAFVKTVKIILDEKQDSYDRLKAAFEKLLQEYKQKLYHQASKDMYNEYWYIKAGLLPEKGEENA